MPILSRNYAFSGGTSTAPIPADFASSVDTPFIDSATYFATKVGLRARKREAARLRATGRYTTSEIDYLAEQAEREARAYFYNSKAKANKKPGNKLLDKFLDQLQDICNRPRLYLAFTRDSEAGRRRMISRDRLEVMTNILSIIGMSCNYGLLDENAQYIARADFRREPSPSVNDFYEILSRTHGYSKSQVCRAYSNIIRAGWAVQTPAIVRRAGIARVQYFSKPSIKKLNLFFIRGIGETYNALKSVVRAAQRKANKLREQMLKDKDAHHSPLTLAQQSAKFVREHYAQIASTTPCPEPTGPPPPEDKGDQGMDPVAAYNIAVMRAMLNK